MSETGNEGILIVGLGAYTAVGHTAPHTAAAVQAGVARTGEHPEALLPDGEPMVVAMAPGLEPNVAGVDRLVGLLEPALNEALGPLENAGGEAPPLPVLLALPEPRPGLDEHTPERVVAALAGMAPAGCTLGEVKTMATGHAAGLAALAEAATLLRGDHELCLVAGADSYLDAETLAWLAGEDRVLAGTNPHGFIPGEGAGCLLLATAEAAARLDLACLGRVSGVAVAREEHTIYGQGVCTGQGLTAAFREALGRLPDGAVVRQLMGDMNGERYRAEEYAYAMIRNREKLAETVALLAPADRWGDVGAASALLALVLVSRAATRGYAPGEHTLVWASSVEGQRGAAVVNTAGLKPTDEPVFAVRS